MEVPQRGMGLPAGRLLKSCLELLSLLRQRAVALPRNLRWVGLAAFLLWAWTALAASFVYDANGRLVAASNDAGATARYHYDPLGNISRIERLQAGDLAIFDFSPNHGGSGDVVRISGQGFSPTASQNVVMFNGVAASVDAASAQALIVAVPNGATTGPLTVSVGALSASSEVPFLVDAHGRMPVISSVAPLIASAGTPITLVGQSLQPVTGQTTARLGSRPVTIAQVSNTQLTFPVPTANGSGKAHVTTPYGTATSADDIVVVPVGVDAADISQATRLAVDGSLRSMSISTAGQRVAVIFDAEGGDYISAQFSALAAGAVDYSLYGADNKRLAWGTVSPTSPSFHLPKLKSAGTHLLLLTPTVAPLSWNLQLERAVAVVVDGPLAQLVTTVAGQSKRLLLDAQLNVPLGLGLAEPENPVAWGTATVEVSGPDGSHAMLQHCSQKNNGCSLNLNALQTGRHSVLVTPSAGGARLLGFQMALSSEATTSLVRDTAHALVLDRPGRNGRLRFTGTAGEVLGLVVTGQTTSPAGRAVYYRIHSPDGAVWKSGAAVSGLTMNLSLPATGDYQLFVDAEFAETLQAQVMLSSGTGPVTDGAPRPFLTTLPGQGVYFSFAAGSAQQLGLGISALTINNGTAAAINVYRPDGSLLANTTCQASNGGCDVNLAALSAGVHGVEVLPINGGQTMAFNATLSTDTMLTLSRHVATPFALSRRGQNARLSFAATAGEVIALKISGQTTTPTSQGVYYRAYHPDGSNIASGYASTEKTLLIDAPVAGAYQVFVDPEHGATTFASLLLEAGVLGEMEPDGSIGQYQSAAGANVSFTIAASAGKHAGFGLSHLSLNTGTYVRVYAYAPSGATVGDEYCYVSNGGCDIDIFNPVSGTYSIVVKPQSASQTMIFRATQSSSLATTLSRNMPYSMSLDRRGQDALMSFEGMAGETVALQVAGQAALPAGKTVKYYLYKPSERRISYQIASLIPTTGGATNLSLPETGTYWIWADPEHGAAATAQVTLSTGTTSGMVQDGASASFSANQPGQSAHFRIEATAGQHLGFAISSLVINAGDHVRVYAYAPNGAAIGDESYCYAANGGCDIDIYNPVSGTYSIVVVPSIAAQMMQFNSTLSSDVPGALIPDAPVLLNLGRRGQDGLLTFSGTKGQIVALRVAGQSTMPARNPVKYQVYKPSDRRGNYAIASMSPVTGGALNLVLPETGTYWVWADPKDGASSAAQVTLSTGTSDGVTLNGPAALVETALPGQTAYFSFNATAGQHLGFAVSDLVLSSDAYVRIYAYAPSGASLSDDSYCYAENGGCDIDIYNAAAGTYSVLLVPFGLDQAMQFKATLTTSVTNTLARDAPLMLGLGRPGQDAVMKFEGAAGETVALLVGSQSSLPAAKAVRYQVYKPSDRRNGYAIASINPTNGSAVNLMLPETGTYWVWADPEHGATAGAQVTLSTGTTNGMVRDGVMAAFNATLPGQPAHFRFEALAGQHMGFSLSDLAVSSGSDVRIFAFAPNGASLSDSTYCEVAKGGCDIDIYNPVAGTYSVLVLPSPQSQMMQFTASLSSSVSAGLVRGVPMTLELGRRGQDGMLTFSGTQGEKVTLQVTGQSSVPANSPVRYQLYKPSERRGGYAIASTNPTTGATLNLTLPETGTYWIWVDPERGSRATSTVTLTSTP